MTAQGSDHLSFPYPRLFFLDKARLFGRPVGWVDSGISFSTVPLKDPRALKEKYREGNPMGVVALDTQNCMDVCSRSKC